MTTKKFKDENRETERAWREVKPSALTEAQLEAMDADIQREYGGLGTRTRYERYAASLGGGSMVKGIFHAGPSVERAHDRIAQWQRWRARKFPFDLRTTYERWAKEGKTAIGGMPIERGIKRSGLLAYEEKFGKPYALPEGAGVIEDVDEPHGSFPLAAAVAVATDIARTAGIPDEKIGDVLAVPVTAATVFPESDRINPEDIPF